MFSKKMLAILVASVVLSGCSGEDPSEPTVPSTSDDSGTDQTSGDEDPVQTMEIPIAWSGQLGANTEIRVQEIRLVDPGQYCSINRLSEGAVGLNVTVTWDATYPPTDKLYLGVLTRDTKRGSMCDSADWETISDYASHQEFTSPAQFAAVWDPIPEGREAIFVVSYVEILRGPSTTIYASPFEQPFEIQGTVTVIPAKLPPPASEEAVDEGASSPPST